jgi:transcriptional regulator with XRE-family HTH domain
MLGSKIKQLRLSKGLAQRQIASKLDIDVAYISKIENNFKPISRQYLKKLSKLLEIAEEELIALWLADKLYDVVKNEPAALKAMHLAEDHVLKSINLKDNRK